MTICTYSTPGGYPMALNLEDSLAISGERWTAKYSADFMSFNLTYWGTIIGATKEMDALLKNAQFHLLPGFITNRIYRPAEIYK
jgi:hypothetical protein